MGMFSWLDALTGESIVNNGCDHGPTPCVVICPDNSVIFEDDYEGYGRFGGRDIYALVAQWNKCPDLTGEDDADRDAGISACFVNNREVPPEFPIKILTKETYDKLTTVKYDDLAPSPSCPNQGFFYMEEENDFKCDDEDNEDDY